MGEIAAYGRLGVLVALLVSLATTARAQTPVPAVPTTSVVGAPCPVPVAVSCPPAGPPATCDRPGLIALYGWLPGIDGTVGIGNFGTTISESITDVLHKFKGGGMVHYESGGRTNVLLDVMYAKLGETIDRPITSLDFTVKQWLVEGGVTFGRTGTSCRWGEWLVGARYFSLDNNIAVTRPLSLTRSASISWVEGFGGYRYGTALSDRWNIVVSGNVGGFSAGAHPSWEGVVRFDRQLNCDTILGVGARYLNIDYDKDNLEFAATYFGPFIGVGWKI